MSPFAERQLRSGTMSCTHYTPSPGYSFPGIPAQKCSKPPVHANLRTALFKRHNAPEVVLQGQKKVPDFGD